MISCSLKAYRSVLLSIDLKLALHLCTRNLVPICKPREHMPFREYLSVNLGSNQSNPTLRWIGDLHQLMRTNPDSLPCCTQLAPGNRMPSTTENANLGWSHSRCKHESARTNYARTWGGGEGCNLNLDRLVPCQGGNMLSIKWHVSPTSWLSGDLHHAVVVSAISDSLSWLWHLYTKQGRIWE